MKDLLLRNHVPGVNLLTLALNEKYMSDVNRAVEFDSEDAC